jgi:hypothetical protein
LPFAPAAAVSAPAINATLITVTVIMLNRFIVPLLIND